MPIIEFLKYLSVWSIVVPLILGLYLIKKLNRDSLIITLLVLGGFIPQVLSNEFFNLSSFKTVTYNLYTPFEFFCYTALFYNKFVIKKIRSVYYLLITIFTLSSFFLIIKTNIFNAFINEWVIVSNLIQLIWAGLYLIQIYWKDDLSFESNEPFFWFLIAIICYASCTTVFYSLWYVVRSKPFQHHQFVNGIHHVFNISLYLLFTIGLLKNKKQNQYHGEFG